MGVVQQAVADRVGQGRLAEVIVPLGGWQLARDDGRVGAIAILQDLEEVAALRILDRRQPPVVDDEDIPRWTPKTGQSWTPENRREETFNDRYWSASREPQRSMTSRGYDPRQSPGLGIQAGCVCHRRLKREAERKRGRSP